MTSSTSTELTSGSTETSPQRSGGLAGPLGRLAPAQVSRRGHDAADRGKEPRGHDPAVIPLDAVEVILQPVIQTLVEAQLHPFVPHVERFLDVQVLGRVVE